MKLANLRLEFHWRSPLEDALAKTRTVGEDSFAVIRGLQPAK
jgi:hypothetical protein